MAKNADSAQSTEQIAKANRKRLAIEEGSRAMEEVASIAIAVRKNMARLRELRLAEEAESDRVQVAQDDSLKAKPKKKLR